MIIANNVSLRLGDKTIYDGVSFCFNEDQRVGLVGRNGTGKSTMLKVLAGTQEIDSGQVSIEKGVRLGYLPQEVVLVSNKNVVDEAFSVFDDADKLKRELDELDHFFATGDKNNVPLEKIERYAQVQAEIAEFNIDGLRAESKRVLEGLGFNEETFQKKVHELSVGWRMRLVLGKLLLQKPDFYLFDEPTNHLDMVAKDWFLDFLKKSGSGFIIVSHDRFFLDHLSENIFELDQGRGKLYKGNYTRYRQQKEEDEAALEYAAERQQKEIKAKMEVINRFKAKASKAGMAKSMLKSVEKMEIIEPPKKLKTMRLSFAELKQPGKVVLTTHNLTKSFNDKELFRDVSFELFRDEKAAIVAPNGCGKTTLINMIMGKYQVPAGAIEVGYNVEYAIFEQDQETLLDHERQIIQEVESVCKTSEARTRVRMLLGTFLFPGDDVYKKIGVLSGGEKNRVAMVKVFLQQANFLILDEPTNHLDIESKEILLKALQQYPGTILFVSHDRDFLDALATTIYELSPTGIRSYKGNYSSYLYQKQAQQKSMAESLPLTGAPRQHTAGPVVFEAPVLTAKESYELRKKMNKAEDKLEKLEAQLLTLQAAAAALTFGSPEFNEATNKVNAMTKQISDLYAEWEAMQKIMPKI